MPALPPDSTARVKITYNVATRDHVLLLRYKAPATVADVIDFFTALTTALSPLLFPSTFVQAQAADPLSNIFNPVGGGWPVSWGTGDPQAFHTAFYYDFVGRSHDGRRARLAFFGANVLEMGTDYRISTAENSHINDAVSVMNAAPNIALSINGFKPTWYNYVNSGVNAYWRNHIR